MFDLSVGTQQNRGEQGGANISKFNIHGHITDNRSPQRLEAKTDLQRHLINE